MFHLFFLLISIKKTDDLNKLMQFCVSKGNK